MTGYEFTMEAIVQAFQLLLKYIGAEWFREQADPFERKLTADELARHEYRNTQPAHPLINWYLLFPSWKAECEKRGTVSLPPQIVNIALLGQSLNNSPYARK
ncbi:MAG: hypothetical protein H0X31_02095 [Nostocaceae cyanobacterium]|nr:hypothetical protein [Nostocaceae cyanobacterium]